MNRIGLIGIVVENPEQSSARVNKLLSEYSDIIIGRMGIPYDKRNVCVISVMVDGTNERIGALSGKLGRIESVSVKSVLTQKSYEE